MFDHLLESSRWDDSNKWSNIEIGEGIVILEIEIRTLSGALVLRFWGSIAHYKKKLNDIYKAHWFFSSDHLNPWNYLNCFIRNNFSECNHLLHSTDICIKRFDFFRIFSTCPWTTILKKSLVLSRIWTSRAWDFHTLAYTVHLLKPIFCFPRLQKWDHMPLQQFLETSNSQRSVL